MSSPPPALRLEEAPRPHAADTTGAAGDVGGADANRAASGGEVQATICPACMVPWGSDGSHRICEGGPPPPLCIPCGHVYGRSCLEELLRRPGEESAKIEGTVNEKVAMAKANLMLMKERLKKMAEQEKMAPKDVIEFLEQNCPHLMIRVSCLFPSSPTPSMDDVELADVEIVVREGPYNHAVEVDDQGGRGNDVNHTTLVSGEVTDGSYRREVEEVDNKRFGDSAYSGNYNLNASNKEVNGMLPSMNMEAAAEGGERVETKPAARPTCSICMEPWTSTGEHHICCIPCGHVYGWSCLIRWVKYQLCGNESVKCPQCGEGFKEMPIELHAPYCQEVHGYYESKFAEIGASIEDCTVYAELTSHLEELSVEVKLQDAELRALLDTHFAEMENAATVHVALANARLMSLKEQMKNMAEEDEATTEDLVELMELNCHQLFPSLPSLPPCPF
ncbi:hypothetical protein VPH35_080537 [Triticum aestivum]